MGLAGVVKAVFGSGRRIAAALTALAVFATGAMAAGQGLADGPERGDLVRVRFGGDAQQTRVVIELTRSATARLLDQNGEPRLVVALPGVDAGEGLTGHGVGLVRTYEVDQAAGAARLRLTLARPAEVSRRFLLPPGDGVPNYRYVIDLKSARDLPAVRMAKATTTPKVAVERASAPRAG